MKKVMIMVAVLFSLSAEAQKKDTTLTTTYTLDEFRSLLYTIDQLIDSKKASKEIIEFMQKKTVMVADKPKK